MNTNTKKNGKKILYVTLPLALIAIIAAVVLIVVLNNGDSPSGNGSGGSMNGDLSNNEGATGDTNSGGSSGGGDSTGGSTGDGSSGGDNSTGGSTDDGSSGSDDSTGDSTDDPTENLDPFQFDTQLTYKVMQSGEILGTVERDLPEIADGGLPQYPTYGTTLTLTQEEKQAILAENSAINASTSSYDSMDSEGNLYLNGVPTGGKLYKHTASAGLYYGDVSDTQTAVVKRLWYSARPSGNHITGLYAPAGEVIKLELSQADLEKTGGLTIYIGQALSNGQANNIWEARDFNRMPVIVNTMSVSATTAYVGSYLGGPIYVKPNNAGTAFTVTISGAVEYSHFILGQTTEEEFERTKNSTAPYFDLEVWDRGVRHSGAKRYAETFDYDDLFRVAVLWDMISAVSTRVPSGSKTEIGIDFLYDPFVAAGSMVAFVGRNTVNCPAYALQNALDYESFVTDAPDSTWGVIHEYNHHFQRFGFASGGETTNNAVTLVEYSLFTKISAARLASDQTNQGLVGWNRYTNADWVLKQTLAAAGSGTANEALDTYANILHSFGQDSFIRATRSGGGSTGADVWYQALCNATGYDMRYYFETLLNVTVSESVLQEYAAKGLPTYVPVSSIYQTGMIRGNTTFKTMQPYQIDKSIEIDLNTCITLPSGFSYRIISVSAPTNGRLVKVSDNVYTYDLQGADASGEIKVRVAITKDDGSFAVEDVTLILEFQQNQKPNMLERTVYVYTADTMYQTLEEAVANGFDGYTEIIVEDNVNRVQDSNTEIWEPNPGQNAIMQLTGKIEITDTAKYRLAVRGRYDVRLYTSTDGVHYELAAEYQADSRNDQFHLDDPKTYKDYELQEGDVLYFKVYVLVDRSDCYVGLGFGKFEGDSVNISKLNALRTDYVKKTFTSDYFYRKTVTYDLHEVNPAKQTLVSSVYTPWDDTRRIENLFDEDKTNCIHSDRQDISKDNPFELVVDMGEVVTANYFTVVGEPTRVYLPTEYQLYLGDSPDDLRLVADVTGATVLSDCTVTYAFPLQSFRYYKLVVTDTSATTQIYRYIAFRGIEFSVTALGGERLSPDDAKFHYYGAWEQLSVGATYGHVNTTEKGIIEFEFEGTQLAVFSYVTETFGTFELYVDGELQEIPTLTFSQSGTQRVFLSPELTNATHKVRIVAAEGFNVDSFVIW